MVGTATKVNGENKTKHHHLVPMLSRNPDDERRVTTPLELFFDLTFVIAFGIAANELAHLVSENHVIAGVVTFVCAIAAIAWTWTQYTWFASAYDTDDWLFRGLTLVQMLGMMVFALGLPDVFVSASDGGDLDIQVVTLGYVVIRLPMLLQWLRAAKHDKRHGGLYRRYVALLAVAQIVLVGIAFTQESIGATLALLAIPFLLEVVPPVWSEFSSRHHSAVPWHPHHIADRYALVVIIALGEALFGTVSTVRALVAPGDHGWTVDAVALGMAGVILTFGLWWTYFIVPYGHVLESSRRRSFEYAYGHVPLLILLVAIGAGLHVAAYRLEGKTAFGDTATLAAVAVPLALFVLSLFAMHMVLVREVDAFHILFLSVTAVVITVSFIALIAGASLMASLVIVSLAPWVTVVGFEVAGHRRVAGS